MRKSKVEYFQERMEGALKNGYESKAEYYKMRLETIGGTPGLKDKLRDWVAEGEDNLSNGLFHTPNYEYLMRFMDANNGSSDPILTQMAIQYGMKKALEELKKDFEL
jgi:hypothetical protein